MRARVAQATVRVWVEGRDDPCSLTVLVDPEGVDLSRPECFSPRAFMKSPSIYKRVRVRGNNQDAGPVAVSPGRAHSVSPSQPRALGCGQACSAPPGSHVPSPARAMNGVV